jgi:hypothetical protein
MRIPGLSLGDDLDALPWQSTRAEGIVWIPLHLAGDSGTPESGQGSSRGAATVLIRMAPGRGYEPHRHVGTEDVLVLRGGYRDELGTYREGVHAHYAAGSEHAPIALGDPARPAGADNPPCILFAVVPGGIELLERGST